MEWFKSYLTGRKQRVRIGSVVSQRGYSWGTTGSVLSLFNIYINELPEVPVFSELNSYADDSKLYLSFPIEDTGEAMFKLMKTWQI